MIREIPAFLLLYKRQSITELERWAEKTVNQKIIIYFPEELRLTESRVQIEEFNKMQSAMTSPGCRKMY